MKENNVGSPEFIQRVVAALAYVKRQMQREYEQAYPSLREIIHLVLDEEETSAWELSLFPHLIFPDLVELHIATLRLEPVHHGEFHHLREADVCMLQPAFA